jgi:hypothetical protein
VVASAAAAGMRFRVPSGEYRVPRKSLQLAAATSISRYSSTRYSVLAAELLDSFLRVSTPAVLPSSKLDIDDLTLSGSTHGNTTKRK